MDLAKIGKFIQERRKAKSLTQVQLAMKIGVSEKTISKWECGYGFPDATLMLPLCEALEISANELLSGKLLKTAEEYKKEADENLLNLKKEQERTSKFLLNLEWVIGIFSVVILLTFTMIAGYVDMPDYLRIILIVFGLLLCIVGVGFSIIIEKDAGFYECQHCHHKYVPTYKQVLWSAHMGTTRKMKCPKCNKKSWQRKTINKD